MKTQGTHFYFIDPEATGGAEVVKVNCAISLDGFGGARDQLENTCLEETTAKTYEPGLITPSQATLELNFEPGDETHNRIFELYRDGIRLEMAVGCSDGTADPTVGSDDLFDFPTSRSYIALSDSYFSDFQLSFATNSLVKATATIQQSGLATLVRKA